MIGNVFSPYYANARRRGPANPLDHCAINVVLYGAGRKRWAMTERGADRLERNRTSLTIGPSSLVWDGDVLEARIEEITVPLPSRICGRIRLAPSHLFQESFTLDARRLHGWSPLAARAHVEVELDRPALHWRGRAYLDTNWGAEPIEDAFQSWHWSRSALEDDRSVVLYDVLRRTGDGLSLALLFGSDGELTRLAPPPEVSLASTHWRIDRRTRADRRDGAVVIRTLEDTPFYARSLVASSLLGQELVGMHESLSLDRFRTRWVQGLLPFRMPRRA